MVRLGMMASTHQENNSLISYDKLKAIAQSTNISPRSLEQLKIAYMSQIASTRRLDCIRSIRDLIDVLERRDELTEDNVDFFNKLANHCQLNSLMEVLSLYKYMYSSNSMQNTNVYREYRLNDLLQERLQINANFTNNFATSSYANFGTTINGPVVSFVGPLTNEKRKSIYKKLSKELGRDWRNFGRELNITEGEIDNIESQSQDLSTRISKLLKLFEDDECNDPKEHCLLICRALDECQRKDLRRHIEKIMSH